MRETDAARKCAFRGVPLPSGGIIHFRFQGTGSSDPSQPFGAPSGFVLIKYVSEILPRFRIAELYFIPKYIDMPRD